MVRAGLRVLNLFDNQTRAVLCKLPTVGHRHHKLYSRFRQRARRSRALGPARAARSRASVCGVGCTLTLCPASLLVQLFAARPTSTAQLLETDMPTALEAHT